MIPPCASVWLTVKSVLSECNAICIIEEQCGSFGRSGPTAPPSDHPEGLQKVLQHSWFQIMHLEYVSSLNTSKYKHINEIYTKKIYNVVRMVFKSFPAFEALWQLSAGARCKKKKKKHTNTHRVSTFTSLFPCLDNFHQVAELIWHLSHLSTSPISRYSKLFKPVSQEPTDVLGPAENPQQHHVKSSSPLHTRCRQRRWPMHTHIYTLLSVTAYHRGCRRHALTSQLNRERPGTARSSITRTHRSQTHTHTQIRGREREQWQECLSAC